MNIIKSSIFTSFLALSSISANAALIDFEDYVAGTIIDNEYTVSNGVTFTGVNVDQNYNNLAVLFDTDNPTGGDSDLAAPFINHNGGLADLSPGNVLIIHEDISDCNSFICNDPDDEGSRPADYFEIKFDYAVTLNSIDFFDIEAEENGTSNNNLISFFDKDGNLLPQKFYTPNTNGDNRWTRLDFNIANIHAIKIKLYDSGAIDNINYTKVPEPTSLSILALSIIAMASGRFKRN